jgi:hypothetical protein
MRDIVAPEVATAETLWTPAPSFPLTRKVTVRVPAESSVIVRDAESAVSPEGSVIRTVTGAERIIADLSVTLKNLSI